MRKIKAIIEYDGTHYHGFQIQPQKPTIQQSIEQALNKLTQKEIRIVGAGRTDAGVHAKGQVISFSLDAAIPTSRLAIALNGLLPPDIRILELTEVEPTFHARYSARWKTYQYKFHYGIKGSVFTRDHAYCLTQPVNRRAMQEAMASLIGTHNFRGLCAAGSSVRSYERTVRDCRLEDITSGLVFMITADGFLYHMVRNIVGTLLQIGFEQRPASAVAQIIASQDRSQAGATAPAEGLYLVQVIY